MGRYLLRNAKNDFLDPLCHKISMKKNFLCLNCHKILDPLPPLKA